ncbi:MAG: shikimate dehydrogenase [Dehalococcoidales bacterium]|jgi:shikimate dehydrogenase|nr:shikimate dehydrogenase [Dehalococcoidales bacterium]MDX9986204.1 shikimate dehydrogenase [Dehalococcoidales bacterium]
MKPGVKICALLGDPIEQSLSPDMHNAAFRDKGLNYIYIASRVKPSSLAEAIEGSRALGIHGLNITIPHKVSVMALLDEIDEASEQIGAVNTVVNTNGVLKGYNTDAAGFTKALAGKNVDAYGKQAVVLGAGGASMAVSYALVKAGASVTIMNRLAHLDGASRLANKLGSISHNPVQAMSLSPQNLEKCLETAEILINATSVGMHPGKNRTLVPEHLLRPEMIVFDLIYNPLQTKLLADAARAGAQTINGLEMLVWQGALAFELWTGLAPPVGIMRAEALKALEGDNPVSKKHQKSMRNKSKNSVVLIGFMGSGKTTVARILAGKTGKRLIELDRLIEINAGISIPEIFSIRGETEFRELEIAAIKEVSGVNNQVISCGGGVILNKINIDRLKENGVVVYLEVNPDEIMSRMQSQSVEKPVLKNPGDLDEVRELLSFREPFYRAYADIIINTTSLSAEETAQQIIARLANHELHDRT